MSAQPRRPGAAGPFCPPRGLGESRPRDVGLSALGKFLVVLAVLFVLGTLGAGLGLERVALRQAETRRLLTETGVDTDAVVVSVRAQTKAKPMSVSYRFTAGGQAYGGQHEVQGSATRTLRVGSPFAIRYAASAPGVNVPRGVIPNAMPAPLPWLTAATCCALASFVAAALTRQRRLLIWGRAAEARVIARQKHSSGEGGAHDTLSYEFPLLSGVLRKGTTATSRKGPAIGDRLCVIYDPDRPSRNAPYPLSLVRPR